MLYDVSTGQHDYEATKRAKVSGIADSANTFQIADASLESDSCYYPPNFNIKNNTNLKTEDHKYPKMVESHAPNPSEEQGDSIAKVLEWFSRSSDSSDKLDSEISVQEIEDDTKIEDSDFEEEVNLRAKSEDNVYLIIPRQSHTQNTPKVNDAFSMESGWGKELNVDEPEPLRDTQDVAQQRFESKPARVEPPPVSGSSTYPSFQTERVTHRKVDIFEKTGSKLVEKLSTKGESDSADKLESPDNKLTQHQLKETEEDSQPPKIANLKSFWEKGNTGPKILVSRSNMNSEKDNKPLNQSNVGMKVTDYVEEPPKVEASLKADYPVAEMKEQPSVKEFLNVDESKNTVSTGPNPDYKQGTIIKDVQRPWSFTNQKKDTVVSNSSSDTDITSLLHLKSPSPSVDSGSFLGDQTNENMRGTMNINSGGDRMFPAVTEVDHRSKTDEKESQVKPGSPPTSSIDLQQPNPVVLAKQSGQQQDSRAERIKQLKLFWEKEKFEPRIYVRSAGTSDTKSSGKLSKRFTKSEFDLRSIGTELDNEPEDNVPSPRGRQSPNFTLIPLRDRTDKSVTSEGMNSLQFKNLRDFWAGSSTKISFFENKSQRPLSPDSPVDARLSLNQNFPPNQSDKSSFTGFGNDSGSTKPSQSDRAPQSSLKEKTAATRPDSNAKGNFFYKPSGELDFLRSAHSSQPQRGLQSPQKDTVSPKPSGMLNKEPRQQTRRSSKGTLNGRGNSLRRAISMFSLDVDTEDQGQDFHSQSKKATDTNLPQLRKSTEVSMPPYRKAPEANSQIKKTPEIIKNKEKLSERRPSRTSEDSDSQPLARSFVPRDYQHYLGISERRGMFTPPQGTEQKSELVCTPFQTSPETGRSLRCSPVQASTPLGSAELRARRGSLGLRPSAQNSEDFNPEASHEVDPWSRSRGSSNRELCMFPCFKNL